MQIKWDGPKLFEGTQPGELEVSIANIRNLSIAPSTKHDDRIPDAYVIATLI